MSPTYIIDINIIGTLISNIIFPRVILYNFFLFWLVYGDLGFGVKGPYIGFLGLGFSVDEVFGLWCRAYWVFWVGTLFINIKE